VFCGDVLQGDVDTFALVGLCYDMCWQTCSQVRKDSGLTQHLVDVSLWVTCWSLTNPGNCLWCPITGHLKPYHWLLTQTHGC